MPALAENISFVLTVYDKAVGAVVAIPSYLPGTINVLKDVVDILNLLLDIIKVIKEILNLIDYRQQQQWKLLEPREIRTIRRRWKDTNPNSSGGPSEKDRGRLFFLRFSLLQRHSSLEADCVLETDHETSL